MSEVAQTSGANLIRSLAEIPDVRRSQNQKLVLPLTVLRRLDAVLMPHEDESVDNRGGRRFQ